MKTKFKIGDEVELLHNELLDDHYQAHKRTVVKKSTIMQVIAVTPKVRMTKGEGKDNKPCFLNLVMIGTTYPRVRTNFCNVKKVKKISKKLLKILLDSHA
jgi:hypothetical protein